MTVLRVSPWYQEILEEGLKEGLEQGLQKGREEGLEQGLEQGILQGRREDILHLLRTRFYLQAESLAAFTERLDQEAPPPTGD